jgi:hypothetical protein
MKSKKTIGGGKMTKYTEKDAAKDCDDSIKNMKSAWHQARNDSAGSWGVPKDRHNKKDESESSGKGGDNGDSGK